MSNLSYTNHDSSTYSVGTNPLLIKMYQSHGIRGDAIAELLSDERAELCGNVIELIEQTNRMTDREMATDILLSLLRHAEKNLKQAIAERLSAFDEAPLRLMLQFINDDIDVARPVLKYSKALNDLDLIYIIQSRDSPFWQAIAGRDSLGEMVVETLVETKDTTTVQNLLENNNAQFSNDAVQKLVLIANDNESLIASLFLRGNEFTRKLYAYAGEVLKQEIAKHTGEISSQNLRKLDDVLEEFIEAPRNDFVPTASMIKAAELFQEQGKLIPILMVNTLKRGQISSFIAQFSRFINLPVAVVIPMLHQKNGQGLAIASKANGIERNDFLMIYNFTRKMMGEDFLSSGEVQTALAYFDRVSSDVAKRLMQK